MGDRNSKTGQDCSILHVLPIAYCLAPIAEFMLILIDKKLYLKYHAF